MHEAPAGAIPVMRRLTSAWHALFIGTVCNLKNKKNVKKYDVCQGINLRIYVLLFFYYLFHSRSNMDWLLHWFHRWTAKISVVQCHFCCGWLTLQICSFCATVLPAHDKNSNVFSNNIFKLHGMPTSKTNDCNSFILGTFWKELWWLLGTHICGWVQLPTLTYSQIEILNHKKPIFLAYWRLTLTMGQMACMGWLVVCHLLSRSHKNVTI